MTSEPSRIRSGRLLYLLIAGSFVLSVAMGLRQSLGLFLAPMTTLSEISASAFGAAMAIQNLAWGVTQPFVGMLADRYGARTVVLVAGPVYGLGLLLMALAGEAGLHLGGGVLVGLAVSGSAFGVVLGAVARQAPEHAKAFAVSIVAAAGSIGTLILAPLGQHLIAVYGWVVALLIFAAVATSISMAGAALERRPEKSDARPSTTSLDAVREACAHRGFIAMSLAFFACGFQLVFMTTHLPTYLQLCGLSPQVGATALAVIGVFNAVGTLAIGALGARFGNAITLTMVYLIRTIAVAVFLATPVSVETTMLFAAVMGILWLSVVPLVSGLITSFFGAKHFGALFGVMFFSHQLGSFAGAWLGGVSLDLTGDYEIAWLALIAIGVLSVLLQATVSEPPRPATI